MKRIFKNGISDSMLKIIDILICIFIVLLSIKKGGFYTSDCININVFIGILGLIYIIISIFFCSNKNQENIIKKDPKGNVNIKNNIIYFCVIMLPIAYILPIIFKKTIDFDDSFFEMIRYLNFAVLFFVVLLSKNKGYYLNTINIVAIFQIILGIDEISIRYFDKYLNFLNSGYQSIDINRMSGTIQYANTLAIIFAISYLLILDKIALIYKKNDLNESDNIKIIFKKLIIYILMFLELASIILTGSRFVILFLSISIIIYSLKDKQHTNDYIYLNCYILIFSLIFSNIIQKYISTKYIYYIFILSIIIFCLIYIIFKILTKKLNYKKDKIFLNRKILMCFIILIAIYIIAALNIDKPLIIDSNKNFEINRLALNVIKNKVNNFEIKVDEQEADTRYSIYLISQDGRYQNIILTTFYYYNTTNGEFKFSFIPTSTMKKLKIYIRCDKGKIKVNNCKLNDKKIIMDYLLLPSDFIYRIEDALTGTSSMTDRIEYIKDAIKLVKKKSFYRFRWRRV